MHRHYLNTLSIRHKMIKQAQRINQVFQLRDIKSHLKTLLEIKATLIQRKNDKNALKIQSINHMS